MQKELTLVEKNHVLKEVGKYKNELEASRMAEMERKREYAETLKRQMMEREKIKVRPWKSAFHLIFTYF